MSKFKVNDIVYINTNNFLDHNHIDYDWVPLKIIERSYVGMNWFYKVKPKIEKFQYLSGGNCGWIEDDLCTQTEYLKNHKPRKR